MVVYESEVRPRMNFLKHLKECWRYYLPAVGAFGLGFVFLVLPALAVLLVVGALFAFGVLYAGIIYRFHEYKRNSSTARDKFYGGMGEPNFKNVTFRMGRQVRFFRDLN